MNNNNNINKQIENKEIENNDVNSGEIGKIENKEINNKICKNVSLKDNKPSIHHIFSFLSNYGIHLSIIFPRAILLDNQKFLIISKNIYKLKNKGFHSYYLTSILNPSRNKHKWPLISLVRQLLKISGFYLHPFRLSDGYSSTNHTQHKIKLYKRFFQILYLSSA